MLASWGYGFRSFCHKHKQKDKREQADSTSINITSHPLEVGSSSAYMLCQEPASPETQVNRTANFDRAICSH